MSETPKPAAWRRVVQLVAAFVAVVCIIVVVVLLTNLR